MPLAMQNFNSSMVRLEETNKADSFPFCPFQFQYGAIGRIAKERAEQLEIQFQFQYGAIGSFHSSVTPIS